MADVADGEPHLLAGVGVERVFVSVPSLVVGGLEVALVQAGEVALGGSVGLRGDIDHEALVETVGGLAHEHQGVLVAHGHHGGDEPVVVGVA